MSGPETVELDAVVDCPGFSQVQLATAGLTSYMKVTATGLVWCW